MARLCTCAGRDNTLGNKEGDSAIPFFGFTPHLKWSLLRRPSSQRRSDIFRLSLYGRVWLVILKGSV